MNLRSRLAVTLMLVVFVAMLGVGIGAVSAARQLPQDNVDRSLRAAADRLRGQSLESLQDLRNLTAGLDIDNGQTIDDRPDVASSTRFQVILPSGDILRLRNTQRYPVADDELALAIAGGDDIIKSIEWKGVNFRVITFAVAGLDLNGNGSIQPAERGGAIQLARDVDDASQIVRGLLPRIALWGALGSLVAGITGWVIAGRIINPISRLNEAAARVARTQDLAEQIPVDRADEVGRLATSFNTMLAALDTSRRQQHQLVMDANHELRTPLTSLRTNIEVLNRNHERMSDADREQLLDDVTAELNELTMLVSELVESATLLDQSTEPIQAIELIDLITAAAETTRRRTGRVVAVQATAPATVNIRPDLISRAVQNLLSNAHKFSPADTPIDVQVSGGQIIVSDSGAGIPSSDRPHVFERFYRATESRTKPGSGLGLAIVKQIVDSHGGSVFVGESQSGGAAVGIDLSVCRAD